MSGSKSRALAAVLVCSLAIHSVAWAQTSSPSFIADCTTIVPGIGDSASSAFMAKTTVGGLVSGELQSPSFRAQFTSPCIDSTAGAGGCGVQLCGDCDLNLVLNILDALVAAQHAVGVLVLIGVQFNSCDVNSDVDVDVLDALQIAQVAVGLPVILSCC